MIVSADLLRRSGVAPATADAWAGPLTAACQAHGITTAARLAGFLPCILHETGDLTMLVEGLNYSAASLMAQWPARFPKADAERMGRFGGHPADQRAIAERAYGGRYGNRPEGSGDGWLYRGHGCMQTTFFANYQAFAKAIGWGKTIAELPAYLTTPAGASDSAAVFWRQAGCNELCDAGRYRDARVRCNGGTIGLDDYLARHARMVPLLGATPLTKPVPVASAELSETDRLNDQEAARHS